MKLTLCNISGLRKIERAVHDVEEATSIAFDIILEHKVNIYFLHQLFSLLPSRPFMDLVHYLYGIYADDKVRDSGITYKISSTYGSSSSF